jgi:hypothetical protein
MTRLRYAKNIVTVTKEYAPEAMAAYRERIKDLPPLETTVEMERLLWMDDTMVKGASFYMECIWLWSGVTTSGTTEEPHVHDFSEVIGFIGSNPASRDLDARMEINLGDEVHDLTKSCLVHIPPGMKHCPLTFREVNRPVFFFTLAASKYGRTSGILDPQAMKNTAFVPPSGPDASGTKYGRYIFTEPRQHGTPPPPDARQPKPDAKTTHVVSLDGQASRGAFYIDFVWIWSGSMTMSPEPHHHDFDEMIGIIGLDPDNPKGNPRGIDGDVSIEMDGDKYTISKSALIYIPAGLKHCPLAFNNIRKPVLCFTIGNTPEWSVQKQ